MTLSILTLVLLPIYFAYGSVSLHLSAVSACIFTTINSNKTTTHPVTKQHTTSVLPTLFGTSRE